MDYTLIYNPVVTPIIVALVASAGLIALIVRQWHVIQQQLETARKKLFTRAGFFWSSILVFMGVSVWQSGKFFSVTGDTVGFAVALVLDLVTCVLIHAQLEARYRGDHWKANLFIGFLALTCGMSTFANLAMSLNTFQADTMLKNAPGWIQATSPYALASLPLFVIMMSIAAEMVVNIRPLAELNEEEYEADEQKRVHLLDIRNQYAIQQAQIEADKELRIQQIEAMRAARRAAHKELMKQIRDGANAQTPANQQQQPPASQAQTPQEQETEGLELKQIQAAINESEDTATSDPIEMAEEEKQTCESYRLSGHINLSIQEAASLCDCNEKIIKALRTKQILKSPSPNSSLITLASIEAYMSGRKGNVRKPKQHRNDQPIACGKKTVVLRETLLAMNGHNATSEAKLTDFPEILA